VATASLPQPNRAVLRCGDEHPLQQSRIVAERLPQLGAGPTSFSHALARRFAFEMRRGHRRSTSEMYRASSLAVHSRPSGTVIGVNLIHSLPGVHSLLKYSRGWSARIDSPLRMSSVTNKKLKKWQYRTHTGSRAARPRVRIHRGDRCNRRETPEAHLDPCDGHGDDNQ
jgi:hypothetical protein